MTTNDPITPSPSDEQSDSATRTPEPPAPVPAPAHLGATPIRSSASAGQSDLSRRTRTRASDGDDLPATCSPEVELLAVILGCGTRRANTVLTAAGGLRGLAYAREADLCTIGIRPERARFIRSAIELGRRAVGDAPQVGKRLGSASDVWEHLQARLSGLPVEEFCSAPGTIRRMLRARIADRRRGPPPRRLPPLDPSRGSRGDFLPQPPSGDPSPSRQDLDLTVRLRGVGEMCGIAVLDHVVVAASGYVSLSERDWR